MRIVSFPAKSVKLMIDNEIEELTAEASVSLNPNITWMKLVLTDDGYNANKQRIPRDEFKNVIKTGFYMPIKMAQGEISDGHEDTTPLGVMSHLKTDGDTVVALAALWNRERPEDVQLLKDRYAKGESIDFSWEITYEESEDTDEGQSLKNVSMNAATIVGMPAYMGRTPAVALSSENKEGDNTDMDTITLDEHQKKLDELKAEYEAKLSEAQKNLDVATTKSAELEPKLKELTEFKDGIEKQNQRLEKIAAIKTKFTEANITVEDDYFESKAELLLSMNDEQLNFFIQELVSSMAKLETEASNKKFSLTNTKVPPIEGEKTEPKLEDIISYLRSLDK